MAVRVHGRQFPGRSQVFDAFHWEVTEGYLNLDGDGGDIVATFAPGEWNYVEDLDPVDKES